jgi:fatty-acyl-CoA synthase
MKGDIVNVGSWVTKWASLAPEKRAIIFEDNVFTYKQLNDRINKTANMLQNMGIGKGNRVGVLLYNTYQLVEILFALGKIGAIFVPLNTRLVSAELEYILGDSGADVLVFGDSFTKGLEPLIDRLSIKAGCYLCLGNAPSWAESYEGKLGEYPSYEPKVDIPAGGEDPMIIMYTSGTTGSPKGAVLSHRKTFFNSLNADIFYGLTPSDILLAPRPMFHSGGLLVELCPVIYKGGTVIMRGRFGPQDILTSIEKYSVTVLEVSATVLSFILEQCEIEKHDLSSLKICYTGGERVPASLLADYEKKGLIVCQCYGQTETSTLTWLAKEDAVRKRGSVGKPVFHGNVKIVGEEGQTVQSGEIGEIVVSGNITMSGYWGKPELTEDTIIDGWLHTGDLATVDEEGFIYIVDRKKDMFISGGENVYPAEIEKVFLENRKIMNVGVCGIPDLKWGEVGLACIVLKDGESMTAEEAIMFCDHRLARFKIPKVIRFVRELPMNAAQKVVRKKLKEDYLEKSGTGNGRNLPAGA